MSKVIAYPGVYIVKVLKEQALINIGQEKDKRILKSEILSIGEKVQSKYGGWLIPYPHIAVGDILYFLSYEGGYDKVTEDTYAVLFDDSRGFEKK